MENKELVELIEKYVKAKKECEEAEEKRQEAEKIYVDSVEKLCYALENLPENTVIDYKGTGYYIKKSTNVDLRLLDTEDYVYMNKTIMKI
jgi:hypothetical protein